MKPRLRTPTRPPMSRSSSVDSTAPWREASQTAEPPRKLQKLPVPSPPPATTSKAKFPKHFDHKPAGSRWRKRPSDDEHTPIELRCWVQRSCCSRGLPLRRPCWSLPKSPLAKSSWNATSRTRTCEHKRLRPSQKEAQPFLHVGQAHLFGPSSAWPAKYGTVCKLLAS